MSTTTNKLTQFRDEHSPEALLQALHLCLKKAQEQSGDGPEAFCSGLSDRLNTKGLSISTLKKMLEGSYAVQNPTLYNIAKLLENLNVTFENFQSSYTAPTCRFNMAEGRLSEDYIRRDEILNQIMGKLEALKDSPKSHSQRPGSVSLSTSVLGTGGFGKTQIAAGLGHENRIKKLFPDGIAWLQLSEQTSVEHNASVLAQTINGRLKNRATALSDLPGCQQLAKSIGDRHVLLIVDDVWHRGDIKPLGFALLKCPNCCLLLTTRLGDIALKFDSAPVFVDMMSESDASALITSGVTVTLPKDDIKSLISRTGRWPLLIALTKGALISSITGKNSLNKALTEIYEKFEIFGVRAFSDNWNDDERFRHVDNVMALSLDALSRDPDVRRHFGKEASGWYERLAIFPDDSSIPLSLLAGYWQRPVGQIKTFVNILTQHCLVLPSPNPLDETVKLHDVLRDYLRRKPSVVQRLPQYHQDLLDQFEPKVTTFIAGLDQQKMTQVHRDMIPNYYWCHHGYHLKEAKQQSNFIRYLEDINYILGKSYVLKSPRQLELDLQFAGTLSQLGEEAPRKIGNYQTIKLLQKEHQFFSPNICYGDFVTTVVPRILEHKCESLRYQRVIIPDNKYLSVLKASPYKTNVFEHNGTALSCCELPDGRVAYACSYGELRVLNLITGESLLLEGHTKEINGLCLLPDGRVVSASQDETLRIWDINREGSLVLTGHTNWIRHCAVLSDGRIVSASGDNTLRVWNLAKPENMKCDYVLKGHTDWVLCCDELPDGRLVSSSADGTLRIWDLNTKKHFVLDEHRDSVHFCSVLPDGRLISASGAKHQLASSQDDSLIIWNLKADNHERLKGHSGTVNHCCMLPDGRLVSASKDGTLRIWDIDTGKSFPLKGHTSAVIYCSVLSDGRVVSASFDSTLRVWDLNSNSCIVLEGHSYFVQFCEVLANGQILSGANDCTLRVWDPNVVTTETKFPIDCHSDAINDCALLPDGRVVTASEDSTLRVWDLDSGESQILTGHTEAVHYCDLMPDGKVVSTAGDCTLRIWDCTTDTHRILSGHEFGINSFCSLPDGRLVSASSDNTLRVWSLSDDPSLILEGHTGNVESCCVLTDGRIASASVDGTLRVWDLVTKKSELLPGHQGMKFYCHVLPNGHLVSAEHDGVILIHDLSTGEFIEFGTHGTGLHYCSVFPDGKIITSSTGGYDIEIFDPFGGEHKILEGHTDMVIDIKMLRDGRIISASFDKTIRVWDLDTEKSHLINLEYPAYTLTVVNQTTVVIGMSNGMILPLTLSSNNSANT